MNEFSLIEQIRRQTAIGPGAGPGVRLGIGDDAAVLEVPAGHWLVAATDTLNAGVHFPQGTAAFDIGYKCLAVNLSDMAAMGAVPRWALLSLSLPQADPEWVSAFATGFRSLAEAHGVSLVGGDTVSGPLSVSLTALGLVEPGRQLRRAGACAGDLLVVSGAVGGAARVVDLLRAGQPVSQRQVLDRPQPRVRLGQVLAGFASACIDISDGLLADLGHVLEASGCGASLVVDKLPAADLLEGLDSTARWNYQLAGGDDYELLFALPRRHRALLPAWSRELGVPLSVIGEFEAGAGVRCLRADGTAFRPASAGYEHFAGKP